MRHFYGAFCLRYALCFFVFFIYAADAMFYAMRCYAIAALMRDAYFSITSPTTISRHYSRLFAVMQARAMRYYAQKSVMRRAFEDEQMMRAARCASMLR